MANSETHSDGTSGQADVNRSPTVAAHSSRLAAAGSRQYAATLPEHAVRSKEAFLAELPELLKSHRDGAAAYQDGQRIGLAPSRRELFWQLVRTGHDPSRFFVFSIAESQADEVEILFEA